MSYPWENEDKDVFVDIESVRDVGMNGQMRLFEFEWKSLIDFSFASGEIKVRSWFASFSEASLTFFDLATLEWPVAR